ncbi:hypothetical protein DH2020_014680 [Rehmannia glutinosa]|uniref:N-acetyltransferase domain-containing protein n=1 Tax=Rehmannia glutinosa TaxID=99300 RepID=A0ABR0WXU0_REHGL
MELWKTRVNFKSTLTTKEKDFSGELQKLSIPENDKFISPSNFKFDRLQQTDQVHFVAREALDEEYWICGKLQKKIRGTGKEGRYKRETEHIEERRWDVGFEHSIFVAWRDFSRERVKHPLFCLIDGKSSSSYGYIANLCVAKSARRQGIASSMLQFAVVSAKAQGAEKVFVHVYRNSKPAQRLYQKMGFKVVDAPNSQFFVDQTYLLCLENLQTS